MDDDSLPDTINPNNFPAKLWRLVGNPSNKAIRWDPMGEVVVIDQQLFEREVLSPGTATPHEDSFKTSNFSSFVRQLNLYGFRKADPTLSSQAALDGGTCHYFYNPNFQRSHPEHVARLRRLTVDNKAKIRAGLDVSCRLPNRYQRLSGGGDNRDKTLRRRSSPLLSPAHPQSAHPGLTDRSQVMKAYSGTPVPPRYQMRGQSGLPLSQHYSGPPSNSSALQAQQDFLTRANHGNTHFSGYNPQNPHYHPGFYSSEHISD
ncbi:unnamed protein product [Menidia menidia]|uniref:(Atlantic silverside) hypothetical protein n=1 Tax=Menidia menidia TaxID=238744 RepID=A0A8S4AS57_9TELE|nr:unnamed protein product [Menidia menidia]